MRSPRIALGLLLAGLAAANPVRADVSRGAQLSQLWCANCHAVGGIPPGSLPPGPPSFQSIARSGKSVDQLRTFLTHPHGAMPDLSLSRAEIDDLIAYISSLR